MKVVHLCTSDTDGSAARAAYGIHRALTELGEESGMYVAQKASADPAVQRYDPSPRILPRARRILRRERLRNALRRYASTRPRGYGRFDDDRSEFRDDVLLNLPDAELIHLHEIAGFIDFQCFFPHVPLQKPVIWTIHDMNAFTGGCHFDHGCGRFTESCGSCPQLGSTDEHDLSRDTWRRKNISLARTPSDRLFLVTPTHWLAREINRSPLMSRFPQAVIPSGVDTVAFAPNAGATRMRRALEIPEEARVILFRAEDAAHQRRAFSLIDEALNEIASIPDLFLVSLGKKAPVLKSRIPHLHLGALDNDSLLASVYGMADVFILPVIPENLANTVLESMACGTPVAGFISDAVGDTVRDGETAQLAPAGDARGLAQALIHLLSDPVRRQKMGERCRQMVEEEFSLRRQATRYSELYVGASGKTAPAAHSRAASPEGPQATQ